MAYSIKLKVALFEGYKTFAIMSEYCWSNEEFMKEVDNLNLKDDNGEDIVWGVPVRAFAKNTRDGYKLCNSLTSGAVNVTYVVESDIKTSYKVWVRLNKIIEQVK